MKTSQFIHRFFVVNGSLKVIAFILTLALFIWVREDRESAVTGFVPVRLVIPEDQVITSEPVERVRVTVGGRWSDLTKFDPSQLPPVTLEVDSDSQGLVAITAEMLHLPAGLHVTSIQPSYVRIDLEPAASKTVTIRPRIVGAAATLLEEGEDRSGEVGRPAQVDADVEAPLAFGNEVGIVLDRSHGLPLDQELVKPLHQGVAINSTRRDFSLVGQDLSNIDSG